MALGWRNARHREQWLMIVLGASCRPPRRRLGEAAYAYDGLGRLVRPGKAARGKVTNALSRVLIALAAGAAFPNLVPELCMVGHHPISPA
jgi:hypothetical protein